MPKVCIYIPCYNAGNFIVQTVERIPFRSLPGLLEYTILFVDNASTDDSQEKIDIAREALQRMDVPSHVILNDHNLGYGGSVKRAFNYCIDRHIEYIVVLHSDGQYAPEELPSLIRELVADNNIAMVFGSRLTGDPLQGGMPVYKYLANRALSWMQNIVLGKHFSEYHSGYRLYRMELINRIPYAENSNYFDFDNQIMFQICHQGYDIRESPIPTHYGEEISHVSPLRTPLAILLNVLVYMLHSGGIIKSRIYSQEK